MNVFGVGLPEMALIMVLALLVFGPKKLPEIGRSMGKAIKGFQDASREFEEEFKKEAQQIEKAVTTPMKATLEPNAPKVLTPPAVEADRAEDSLMAADGPVEVASTNSNTPEV
jgi:sec-independent protein translocase protein TatA